MSMIPFSKRRRTIRNRVGNALLLNFWRIKYRLDKGRIRCHIGSGANFKKGRRADPGALGERESLACQIGPKFKLCTRSDKVRIEKMEPTKHR